MRFPRFDISPAALLLFSLVYFLDGTGAVSVILPAIAVHEAGHIAALRLCGAEIRRIRLVAAGLVIEPVGGRHGARFRVMSTLAGPAAGLVFALFCSLCGQYYLRLCGAVSFWLSVLNLVPSYPLDGGAALREVLPTRAFRRLSLFSAASVLALGAAVSLSLGGFLPLIFGAWLMIVNIKQFLI